MGSKKGNPVKTGSGPAAVIGDNAATATVHPRGEWEGAARAKAAANAHG